MPLIDGFYTQITSKHSTIYFHLFLTKWQLQEEREHFRAFSLKTGYLLRKIKKANLIPSFLITAARALDHIKRDSDSLVLVGEGKRKTYQQ